MKDEDKSLLPGRARARGRIFAQRRAAVTLYYSIRTERVRFTATVQYCVDSPADRNLARCGYFIPDPIRPAKSSTP